MFTTSPRSPQSNYRPQFRHSDRCGQKLFCWRPECRAEFGNYRTIEILSHVALAHCHKITVQLDHPESQARHRRGEARLSSGRDAMNRVMGAQELDAMIPDPEIVLTEGHSNGHVDGLPPLVTLVTDRKGIEGELAGTLDDLHTFLTRFVWFSKPEQAVAVTLWVAHTHCLDAVEQSPILAISSPVKQSGKSRLLDVIETVVPVPWRIERPSEAVLYRRIERDGPTILNGRSGHGVR